ncbi:hypothetical protein [Polymorphospora lycopeni]|uniref:Uncharacterized protein n=1 Tax=Polymorphospora lycopeni TaxID=3140240 RepID=A0ABV5D1A2_9ACTN
MADTRRRLLPGCGLPAGIRVEAYQRGLLGHQYAAHTIYACPDCADAFDVIFRRNGRVVRSEVPPFKRCGTGFDWSRPRGQAWIEPNPTPAAYERTEDN